MIVAFMILAFIAGLIVGYIIHLARKEVIAQDGFRQQILDTLGQCAECPVVADVAHIIDMLQAAVDDMQMVVEDAQADLDNL